MEIKCSENRQYIMHLFLFTVAWKMYFKINTSILWNFI
jgi:hypothetical protein